MATQGNITDLVFLLLLVPATTIFAIVILATVETPSGSSTFTLGHREKRPLI